MTAALTLSPAELALLQQGDVWVKVSCILCPDGPCNPECVLMAAAEPCEACDGVGAVDLTLEDYRRAGIGPGDADDDLPGMEDCFTCDGYGRKRIEIWTPADREYGMAYYTADANCTECGGFCDLYAACHGHPCTNCDGAGIVTVLVGTASVAEVAGPVVSWARCINEAAARRMGVQYHPSSIGVRIIGRRSMICPDTLASTALVGSHLALLADWKAS